jgi:tRNA(His) 5'-end guanylyltransferase
MEEQQTEDATANEEIRQLEASISNMKDDLGSKNDPLGERMKYYESKNELHLSPDQPFIIRLDGHTFHTFTKGFTKPFDEYLTQSMIDTASDLLEHFNGCRTVFTQSDEITMIFNKLENEKQQLLFKGRVMKIATLASGYCSARFNYHLSRLVPTDHPAHNKATGGIAYFDARVFNVPNDIEVFNNVYWRSTYDCLRNSRLGFGLAHLSAKQIHGLSAKQIVEKVKIEKQLDWNDLPERMKYGTLLKKEQYNTVALNPITNENVPVTRSRVVPKSIFLDKFDPNWVEMLLRKYW